MNYPDNSLLKLALSERNQLGYITESTRASLMDTGHTAASIESALLNMERI